MATLGKGFEFTGSLGGLSAYRVKGSDKIIIRTKGGPSKKQIKTSPKFELTRQNNSEFGGRATASSYIKRMLFPLRALADHNIINSLQPVMRRVQVLDTEGRRGQRNVCLTKAPQLLEGFSLNKGMAFDSFVRCPIPCTLVKEERTARLELPALLPGINLFVPKHLHLYSIVLSLGVVPDFMYHKDKYKPHPDYDTLHAKEVVTAWYPVQAGSGATVLELVYPHALPGEDFCLLAGIGIRFGEVTADEQVRQVARVGAGKVIAVR